MRFNSATFLCLASLAFIAAGNTQTKESPTVDSPALKDVFESHFLVGAALNARQFSGEAERDVELVTRQFNTITAENALKWMYVHPEPGRYDFEATDRYVEFGETHGMFIVGHTLVWHSQTPRWVFEDENGDPLGREALLERMRDHIHTVVGRYKGRVGGWDVVNEALNEDGSLRENAWFNIIGEDYIAKAFEFAHEADPDAGLYYNDYSLPNEAKRDGAVALIRNLQEQGVPVTGIGLQGHYSPTWPTIEVLDSALSAFGSLGIDVMITELDIDVLPPPFRNMGADVSRRAELEAKANPYTKGLPDSMQAVLANQYANLFSVFVDHSDIVTRVTFWGVTDATNWKNNWPVRGRTNYPLLFDREWKPKPAFDAVVRTAKPDG